MQKIFTRGEKKLRKKRKKGLKMKYFYPIRKILIVMVKEQIGLQHLTQALINPMVRLTKNCKCLKNILVAKALKSWRKL